MFGKVLIVDDDTSITDLLQLILKPLGIGNYYANSYNSAISILQEKPDISLVLTDICMPGKGGVDIIGWMLANKPDIEVIAMTGHSAKDKISAVKDLGVNLVLEKPFIHLSEVVAAIISRLARIMKKPLTLVADDCVTFKTFARSALEEADIPVATVGHKETLKLVLERFNPSVVVLDNIMPGNEIEETCRKHSSEIRFISCSSSPVSERENLKSFGIKDFLTKPVSSTELVNVVMKNINQ